MPDQIPTPKELVESAEKAAAEQDNDQDSTTEHDDSQTEQSTDDATSDNDSAADSDDTSDQQDSEGDEDDEDDSEDSEDRDEDRDWKAQSRKHERRARETKKKLDAANRENAKLKSELESTQLRYQVAGDKHVPAELLQGSTKKELEAHAEKLLAFGGQNGKTGRTGPVVPESGSGSDGPIDSEAQKALAALGFS